MTDVFLKAFNLSVTASWIVLAVVAVRLLFKKAPRWVHVFLWGIVGLRLTLPFSLKSIFSLIPSTETLPSDIMYTQKPQIQIGINSLDDVINPIISSTFSPDVGDSVNPMQVILSVASYLWIFGIIVMIVYMGISSFLTYRRVREAAHYIENIYVCDKISDPFIFGVFKPRIYLPFNMNDGDFQCVISHEKAHLKRGDHLWKPLGFLLLTIHWFNPVMWVAYVLLCRDIEFACDEKVLRDMGSDSKKIYSTALINCSSSSAKKMFCPLAFGEVGVKKRIKTILSYKKPSFWILLISLLLSFMIALCFLTDPRTTVDDELAVFLDMQIGEEFYNPARSDDNFTVSSAEILDVSKKGNHTTVYMWVLYCEYSYADGIINEETGYHLPTAITVSEKDGQYKLVEYWVPRDGDLYAADIKEKFPWHIQGDALNPLKFIDKQYDFCNTSAEEYFYNSANINGNGSVLDWDDLALEEKYPEYFGLDSSKGLDVIVWQMAANSYSFALLPRSENVYDLLKDYVMKLKGARTEEMRQILASYPVEEDDVRIIPWQNPLSSYLGDQWIISAGESLEEKQRQYVDSVRKMLFDDSFEVKTEIVQDIEFYVSWVNYCDEMILFKNSLNYEKYITSSLPYLPVFKFDSREELDLFTTEFSDILSFDAVYNEFSSFNDVISDMNEDYFEEYSLFVIYVTAGSGSYRFGVNEVIMEGETLLFVVEQLNSPEVVTTDMAGWFLTVPIPKNKLKDTHSYDARLQAFFEYNVVN